jgi:hypothetical protein
MESPEALQRYRGYCGRELSIVKLPALKAGFERSKPVSDYPKINISW